MSRCINEYSRMIMIPLTDTCCVEELNPRKMMYLVAKNIANIEKEIILVFNLCGKSQRLLRKKNEILSSTLNRISLIKKKLVNSQHPCDSFLIDSTGEPIDDCFTNLESFKRAEKLIVGDDIYHIYRDFSTIKSLDFDRYPMVDIEIGYTLNVDGHLPENCLYQWFSIEEAGEKFLSNSKLYVPTKFDVGKLLKLKIFPNGPDAPILNDTYVEATSQDFVLPYVGPFLYESRQLSPLTQEDIRLISYNILADCYCHTELAAQVMYPNIPAYILDMDYRKKIILKELQHYNGDIIGLQECEQTLFDEYLSPKLLNIGYDGSVYTKDTNRNEGCATFYKRQRFTFVQRYDMNLAECLSSHTSCQILRDSLLNDHSLTDIFNSVITQKSIAQITLLNDTLCKKHILVLNTHLYYAPTADDVRLVQANVILNYITWLRDYIHQNNPQTESPGLILMGDWNSTPGSSAIELILTRGIQHTVEVLPDSQHASLFKSVPYLFSATGFPKFTTCVACFTGCLDYIFVDGKSFCHEFTTNPLPPEDLVLQYDILPSPHAPSDHLPIICDVKYQI